VDGIVLAGNKAKVYQITKMIKNKFKIKEIGEVNFIIGIKFVKHKGGYFLNQEKYTNDIITKYGLWKVGISFYYVKIKNSIIL